MLERMTWEMYREAGWRPEEERQATAVGGSFWMRRRQQAQALLDAGVFADGPGRDADQFTNRDRRDVTGSEALFALYRQRLPRAWWGGRVTVYVVWEHSTVFAYNRMWLYARRHEAELLYDALRVAPIPQLADLPIFRDLPH